MSARVYCCSRTERSQRGPAGAVGVVVDPRGPPADPTAGFAPLRSLSLPMLISIGQAGVGARPETLFQCRSRLTRADPPPLPTLWGARGGTYRCFLFFSKIADVLFCLGIKLHQCGFLRDFSNLMLIAHPAPAGSAVAQVAPALKIRPMSEYSPPPADRKRGHEAEDPESDASKRLRSQQQQGAPPLMPRARVCSCPLCRRTCVCAQMWVCKCAYLSVCTFPGLHIHQCACFFGPGAHLGELVSYLCTRVNIYVCTCFVHVKSAGVVK